MSGAGKRVAAVAVAVAAIAGGTAVRNRDGGPGDTPDRGGYELVTDEFAIDDESTWFFEDGAEPRVRCVVELAQACEDIAAYWELDVTVEPVWATIDAIRSGALGPDDLDGWITVAPFHELATPAGGEPFLRPGDRPLARSAVAALADPERLAALRRACLEDVTGLLCALDSTGRPWSELGGEPGWGEVAPVLPDPELTAAGTLALATLLEEASGGRPLDAEALATPELQQRLQRWADAGPRLTVDPAEDMARLGPAGGDVTVGLEAGGAALVDYPDDPEATEPVAPLVPSYPTRVMTADVQLLVTDTFALADQLRVVMGSTSTEYDLSRAGWQTPEGGFPYPAAAAEVWEDRPTPPTSAQAPPAEVLSALRDRWQGATAAGEGAG